MIFARQGRPLSRKVERRRRDTEIDRTENGIVAPGEAPPDPQSTRQNFRRLTRREPRLLVSRLNEKESVSSEYSEEWPKGAGWTMETDHEGFISLHKYWLQTLSPVTTQKADTLADWLGKSFLAWTR